MGVSAFFLANFLGRQMAQWKTDPRVNTTQVYTWALMLLSDVERSLARIQYRFRAKLRCWLLSIVEESPLLPLISASIAPSQGANSAEAGAAVNPIFTRFTTIHFRMLSVPGSTSQEVRLLLR